MVDRLILKAETQRFGRGAMVVSETVVVSAVLRMATRSRAIMSEFCGHSHAVHLVKGVRKERLHQWLQRSRLNPKRKAHLAKRLLSL